MTITAHATIFLNFNASPKNPWTSIAAHSQQPTARWFRAALALFGPLLAIAVALTIALLKPASPDFPELR